MAEQDSNRPRRRPLRLPGYDYSQPGAYFVTICSQGRSRLFGEVSDGKIVLNGLGEVVKSCWRGIPAHFPQTSLDEFIVMPNHLHGIITLDGSPRCRGIACYAPTEPKSNRFGKLQPGSVPVIIRGFKSAVTARINELRGMPGAPVWQRGYYEHIIRGEDDLSFIREYIRYNAVKWDEHQENLSKFPAL